MGVREEASASIHPKDGDVPMEGPRSHGDPGGEASCSVMVLGTLPGEGFQNCSMVEGKTGTRSEAERAGDAWEIMGKHRPG